MIKTVSSFLLVFAFQEHMHIGLELRENMHELVGGKIIGHESAY